MPHVNMGKNTVERVWEIVEPIVDSLGLTLWDIRFEKEGSSWFLRIIIDKDGGIAIDDCEAVSRAVDAPLDEADPIPQSYCLEVSSPGIGRKLTRDFHFSAKQGERVLVKLFRPIDGKREFSAVLKNYESGVVTVSDDSGEELSFDKNDASYIKLDDDIYFK